MVKKNRYFDLNEREAKVEKNKNIAKVLKESWKARVNESFVRGDGFATSAHLHDIKKPFREENLDGMEPVEDAPEPVSVDEPEGSSAKENEASVATKSFIDSLQLPTEANFVELPKVVAPVEDVVEPEVVAPEGEEIAPEGGEEIAPEGEEVVAEADEISPEGEEEVVAPDGEEEVAPVEDVVDDGMEASGVFMGEINDPQHGAFKILVFPASLYDSISAMAAAVDPAQPEVGGDEGIDDLGAEEPVLDAPAEEPVETTVEEPVEDEELAEEVAPQVEEDEEDADVVKESKQYPTGQGKKDWKAFFESRYKK